MKGKLVELIYSDDDRVLLRGLVVEGPYSSYHRLYDWNLKLLQQYEGIDKIRFVGEGTIVEQSLTTYGAVRDANTQDANDEELSRPFYCRTALVSA